MKSRRIDIASIRREEILAAAVAVIVEQGLQNLSLSEIEKKAGMSRGQLTYYFRTKEDILLAVFDRVVGLMYERVGTPAGEDGHAAESGWEWSQHLLQKVVGESPVSPAFSCLQHTFLAQAGHREDFRARLAQLYEEWRENIARGLDNDRGTRRPARDFSPRAVATVVQALLHGLAVQAAVDPQAFDRQEILKLCVDLLGNYLWAEPPRRKGRPPAPKKKSSGPAAARRARRPKLQGVNGERPHG